MTQKTPVATIIVSSVSVFFSILALVFAIVCRAIIGFDNDAGGDYVTNEVVIQAFGIVVFLMLSWGMAILGGIMSLVTAIVILAKKHFKFIWIPLIGIPVAIVAFIIAIP